MQVIFLLLISVVCALPYLLHSYMFVF